MVHESGLGPGQTEAAALERHFSTPSLVWVTWHSSRTLADIAFRREQAFLLDSRFTSRLSLLGFCVRKATRNVWTHFAHRQKAPLLCTAIWKCVCTLHRRQCRRAPLLRFRAREQCVDVVSKAKQASDFARRRTHNLKNRYIRHTLQYAWSVSAPYAVGAVLPRLFETDSPNEATCRAVSWMQHSSFEASVAS